MRLEDAICISQARLESLLREVENEKHKLEMLKRELLHVPQNVAPFLCNGENKKP